MFKQTILAAAAVAAMTTGAMANPWTVYDANGISHELTCRDDGGLQAYNLNGNSVGISFTGCATNIDDAIAAAGIGGAYSATGGSAPSYNGLNADGGFRDGEDANGRENRLRRELNDLSDGIHPDPSRLAVIEQWGTDTAKARARTIRLVRECEDPTTPQERKQEIADFSRSFHGHHIAVGFASLSNDQARAVEDACETNAGRPAAWAPIDGNGQN